MRPILLKGHDGPLTCVKYNKDGDLLFTTCRRGRINLWYSDDGERIGTYNSGQKQAAVMYVDVNCKLPLVLPSRAKPDCVCAKPIRSKRQSGAAGNVTGCGRQGSR
jgi:WD40 repeat protein